MYLSLGISFVFIFCCISRTNSVSSMRNIKLYIFCFSWRRSCDILFVTLFPVKSLVAFHVFRKLFWGSFKCISIRLFRMIEKVWNFLPFGFLSLLIWFQNFEQKKKIYNLKQIANTWVQLNISFTFILINN